MKDSAVLINTARGGLVDSQALADALSNGDIAAAAIDVLPKEPPIAGDPLLSLIYKSVSDGVVPAGIEYYLPLYFERLETIFDYLPEQALLILPEQLQDDIQAIWQNLAERYEQRRHDIERPLLPPDKLFLDAEAVKQLLDRHPCVLTSTRKSTVDANNVDVARPPELLLQSQSQQPAKTFIDYLANYPGRILLVAETAGRREALNELLRDNQQHARACENWHAFTFGTATAVPEPGTLALLGLGLLGIGAAGGSLSANEGKMLQARLEEMRKERETRAKANVVANRNSSMNTLSPASGLKFRTLNRLKVEILVTAEVAVASAMPGSVKSGGLMNRSVRL